MFLQLHLNVKYFWTINDWTVNLRLASSREMQDIHDINIAEMYRSL